MPPKGKKWTAAHRQHWEESQVGLRANNPVKASKPQGTRPLTGHEPDGGPVTGSRSGPAAGSPPYRPALKSAPTGRTIVMADGSLLLEQAGEATMAEIVQAAELLGLSVEIRLTPNGVNGHNGIHP